MASTQAVRASRRATEASDVEPNHQEALFAELGEAHQQGRPSGPARLKGCEGPLKIVAYITDEISIKRILDDVGLSPPEQEKPEPP